MTEPFIKPKEVMLLDEEGKERQFIISKFDALSGREIVTQYMTSAIPTVGSYAVNQEIMLKMMTFVARISDDTQIRLLTPRLYTAHVESWEMSLKLESLMMEYNCSFFQGGMISNFLKSIIPKLPPLVIKIWTILSESLLPKEKPPSTN